MMFSIEVDCEKLVVDRLVQTVMQAGICNNPTAVVNLYIALKTKPLAILAGPAMTGKLALLHCLAGALTGGGCEQCQFLAGHPWNAEHSGNMAFFTDLHTRYNSEKLLCLIEEAWRLENSGKVYIACLARISQAEVTTLFSEIAFQARQGHIMQFGDVHFSTPLPYPPNFFLVGTLDIPRFDVWNHDLLSATTIIPWHETRSSTHLCPSSRREPYPQTGSQFLAASTRNLQAVYQKLHTLLAWVQHPMEPFFKQDALVAEDVNLPRTAIQEAMTYVANSWTRDGEGLFSANPDKNLTVAVDLAIAQTLLPYAAGELHSSTALHSRLTAILDNNYPISAIMLNDLVGSLTGSPEVTAPKI
jgi:hypothetical protein